MKKGSIILMLLSLQAWSQEGGISKKLALGYQIGQYQDDFNVGLNVTTPYFANGRMAIRLRGNWVKHQHPDESGEDTWTGYSNISIGLVGVSAEIQDFMRLYGEGGLLLLFPSETIDSKNAVANGFGFFGFEFYAHRSFNYFLEAGGGGGSVADRLVTRSIYSNGFIIQTGFRFHLK